METAFTLWLLIIGALFVLMALTGTTLQRLPLTTAIIYLAVGVVLGVNVLGVLSVSRTCKVRGRIADHVYRLRDHF